MPNCLSLVNCNRLTLWQSHIKIKALAANLSYLLRVSSSLCTCFLHLNSSEVPAVLQIFPWTPLALGRAPFWHWQYRHLLFLLDTSHVASPLSCPLTCLTLLNTPSALWAAGAIPSSWKVSSDRSTPQDKARNPPFSLLPSHSPVNTLHTVYLSIGTVNYEQMRLQELKRSRLH